MYSIKERRLIHEALQLLVESRFRRESKNRNYENHVRATTNHRRTWRKDLRETLAAGKKLKKEREEIEELRDRFRD